MKKVILMAALVLACTAGSNASAMNEAALNASNSELMPVKKTTKKSTKKSSSKKSTTKTTKKSTTKTSTKKSTSTSVDATTGATTSATAATTTSIGSIISGLLNNVIGSGTFSKEDLCAHTWKYSKPGCAFTSENLLAKAGGEIAASKIEEDLSKYYSKFGFSKSNTYFTFKTDGTFAAKIDGKSWNGIYTFDEKTHAIQLKGLLLSASGFATRTANGISLLFEQKKLLTLIKTLSKLNLTGSTTMSAVSSIVDNYDGVRIGFEMTK